MSVLDYLSNEEGVKANDLSPLRPMTTKQQLIKLHNILQTEFYDEPDRPAMEICITFDDKKVWVGAIDDLHLMVKVTLPKDAKVFLIREFSPRVHYHGIIKGSNTAIGKYMALIKRLFGRVSYIKHISYPRSYIPYMLKDMWYENEMDYTRTCRTFLLTDMMVNTQYKYNIDMIEYTGDEIQRINEERLQNKRTKNNQGIYRKRKK